jgi:UrcA family protein
MDRRKLRPFPERTFIMLNRKALISIALCAGTLAVSTPALAQERTAKVTVRDLDLADPSDQAELQNRVTRAVRTVCSSNGSRGAREHVEAKKCEARTQASTETKVAARIAQSGGRSVAARTDVKLASD